MLHKIKDHNEVLSRKKGVKGLRQNAFLLNPLALSLISVPCILYNVQLFLTKLGI